MTFDRIDRQFKPKSTIRLECEVCSSTADDVKTRTDFDLKTTTGGTPMCSDCYSQWCAWRNL